MNNIDIKHTSFNYKDTDIPIFLIIGKANNIDKTGLRSIAHSIVDSIKPHNNGYKFSISYSEPFFAIAYAKNYQIGVDIEQNMPIKEIELVKEMVLSQKEQQTCTTDLDFYKIWTQKESYLKATGIGIHDNLHTVTDLSICQIVDTPYTNLVCSICLIVT